MRRLFGRVEAGFDLLYLTAALGMAALLTFTGEGGPARTLGGIMAFLLAAGDACHLIPRVLAICARRGDSAFRKAMGRGKQVASITMTVFYVLLFHAGRLILTSLPAGNSLPAGIGLPAGNSLPAGIGLPAGILNSPLWIALIYPAAALRILLCLLPQNRWQDPDPPAAWGVRRNIPFLVLGLAAAAYFFLGRAGMGALAWAWLAILLSFLFYLPVVLFVRRAPQVGALMLPKSCAYLWLISMFLAL